MKPLGQQKWAKSQSHAGLASAGREFNQIEGIEDEWPIDAKHQQQIKFASY